MKTAIILHGMPFEEEYYNSEISSPSNTHWLSWLQQQLIVNKILAQTPEFPEPYKPVYEKWCEVFEQFKVDKDTILVGHSCGAGFLLRWLSENKINVGKVVLVAPWIDPEKELQTNFFDFEIDKELLSRVESLCVFVSSDDYKVILDSVKIITEQLPQIAVKNFEGKGHFTLGEMKTEKFPELIEYILS